MSKPSYASASLPMILMNRSASQPEDRRGTIVSGRSEDSKLSALKAYQRAKGLCFKCGERWGQTHRCLNSVPLHVVEEMCALTAISDKTDSAKETEEPIEVNGGFQDSSQSIVTKLLPGLQIPEAALDLKLVWRGGKLVPQFLVKWSGWCSSVAAWKYEVVIKQQFPFEITKKINSVAYELAVPPSSSIQPVFHFSLSNPLVKANTLVSSSIPDLSQALQIPKEVLDSRFLRLGGRVTPQVLTRWIGWPASLAT